MIVRVLDRWVVIDRWWSEELRTQVEFVEALFWGSRRVVLARRDDDRVWRVRGAAT